MQLANIVNPSIALRSQKEAMVERLHSPVMFREAFSPQDYLVLHSYVQKLSLPPPFREALKPCIWLILVDLTQPLSCLLHVASHIILFKIYSFIKQEKRSWGE